MQKGAKGKTHTVAKEFDFTITHLHHPNVPLKETAILAENLFPCRKSVPEFPSMLQEGKHRSEFCQTHFHKCKGGEDLHRLTLRFISLCFGTLTKNQKSVCPTLSS